MNNIILQPGTQIQGIDVGKYVMALSVVAIHVEFHMATSFPWMFIWFIRLAVPFFFIVSGFLLAREVPQIPLEEKKFLKKRVVKIIKLYSLWLLIYSPISFVCYFTSNMSIVEYLESIVKGILVYGETPFAWPLWFLYSLLLNSIGLYLTAKSKLWRVLFVIVICIFYIVAQIFQNYDNLIDTQIIEFIYKVFPVRALAGGGYFLCGILLNKWFKYLNNLLITFIFLGISILLFVTNLPFYEILGGIAIFLISKSIRLENAHLSKSLRVQSMWIYYLHMYVIFIIVGILKITDYQLHLWRAYIIILMITMLIAYALANLQVKPKFKFLSNLTR